MVTFLSLSYLSPHPPQTPLYSSTQSTLSSITTIINVIITLTKKREMLQLEEIKCGEVKRHVRNFTVTLAGMTYIRE